MNDIQENNFMIMGLLAERWDNGDDEFLNRLMWNINFSPFEQLALKYCNLKRNTARKIFNRSIAKMAVDLKIRKTICPNRDDLHAILKKEFINGMKEIILLRQKYSFAERIIRCEAKMLKRKLCKSL